MDEQSYVSMGDILFMVARNNTTADLEKWEENLKRFQKRCLLPPDQNHRIMIILDILKHGPIRKALDDKKTSDNTERTLCSKPSDNPFVGFIINNSIHNDV